MSSMPKKSYASPELEEFGSLTDVTLKSGPNSDTGRNDSKGANRGGGGGR